MTIQEFVLTEIEQQCGVTLEQVAETMEKSLMRYSSVVLPIDTPPALAGSVARYAFEGEDVTYLGHNVLGLPVYGLSERVEKVSKIFSDLSN